MKNTLCRFAVALVSVGALGACADRGPDQIVANVDGWPDRPSFFTGECNGMGSMQLRSRVPGLPDPERRSTGNGVPQLERVVVYGNPVQRPYRGYGDVSTYGGMTNVFVYDRSVLDQCSFGTNVPYTVVGPVADDTLDAAGDPPEGVDENTWRSIPPHVRKQLRAAAWYLADHWIPNDIPGIGLLTVQARRALIFEALAKGYYRALDTAPDRRTETMNFARSQRTYDYRLSDSEVLRVDAFLIGCSMMQTFRRLDSWTADQAQEHAARVTAGWATSSTRSASMYWLEPQLSKLGALGAELGRDGDSCGQAARYHFENHTRDLFDPQGSGNGGSGVGNLF